MTPADLLALCTSYGADLSAVLSARTGPGRHPAAIRVREEAVRQAVAVDHMTYRDAGALLGLSTTTVRNILDRLGIPRQGAWNAARTNKVREPGAARGGRGKTLAGGGRLARRGLPMVQGYMLASVGDRDENCGRYTACLTVAARYEHASCPAPRDGDPDGPPDCRWRQDGVPLRAVDYVSADGGARGAAER